MSMKVLFITRSTLHTVKGGDTVQVEETARQLRNMGVQADIRQSHERIDYTPYDLLHFFNIIRPADILSHIKRSGKPFVVSSILVDYSQFEKNIRGGLAGKLFSYMPAGGIEYAKTIYRAARMKDRINSTEYLWKGHNPSIRSILEKARCVIVNAEDEYQQLVDSYGIEPPHAVIPNGVDTELFRPVAGIPKVEGLVICVARIEGIKNQLNLIRAINDSPFHLKLIGNAAPSHQSYYQQCRREAGVNIEFIHHLPQSELTRYYARAKVHVLPSWFEVCGLASLEAAAMGCQVVTTNRGYAHSYFGEEAFYCDPDNPASIRACIERAMDKEDMGRLQFRVSSQYSWKQAAESILSVYKKCLA